MIKRLIKNKIQNLGFRFERVRSKDFIFKYLYPELAKLNNIEILVNAQEYIYNLKNKFENFKIKNKDNGFLVSFLELNIYVETTEEFFILNEIFIEEDYNFSTSSKSVVIDIGTNVGIASLFFSLIPSVDKIYAFEPVTETYNQAKLNFSLNKTKSKVVEFNNFGVGKNKREETFVFDTNFKGNTGVRGALSKSYSNNSNTKEINVKIEEATSVFEKIIKENLEANIVVKMDCEGAEYEIFENIVATNFIKKVDVFMLEWHDKGAEKIEKELRSNGFNCFSRVLAPNAGMIYASKSKK